MIYLEDFVIVMLFVQNILLALISIGFFSAAFWKVAKMKRERRQQTTLAEEQKREQDEAQMRALRDRLADLILEQSRKQVQNSDANVNERIQR